MKLTPLALLAAVLFAGCAAPAPRELSFDYSENFPRNMTIPVEMRPADTAVVTLHENPTTGFRWELAEAPDFCEVKLYSIPPDSDLCGAPGVCNVHIVPSGVGEGAVKLLYRRHWESIPANATVLINLKVE